MTQNKTRFEITYPLSDIPLFSKFPQFSGKILNEETGSLTVATFIEIAVNSDGFTGVVWANINVNQIYNQETLRCYNPKNLRLIEKPALILHPATRGWDDGL